MTEPAAAFGSAALLRNGEPTAMGHIIVRPVEPRDEAAWRRLWAGYLTFYRASILPEATEQTWRRLLDHGGPVRGLVATRDNEVLGLTHYLFHPSSWTVGDYCYLQDLFVDPDARGLGLARALIEAVRARAEQEGASRVYWLTHEDNMMARALYERVAQRSGFIQYRIIL